MQVITEAIQGELINENDVAAVRLSSAEDEGSQVYLTYALVILGSEEPVIPCAVLDDWGKELNGVGAYDWMWENGNHFPRAEIFAVGLDGEERQHFLREFELYARYPAYALTSRTSPIVEAVKVVAMLKPDPTVATPYRIRRPQDLAGPLARARVTWWRVPPGQAELGFLRTQADTA